MCIIKHVKFELELTNRYNRLTYCKRLVIRVTLFSQGHHPGYIHETIFMRSVKNCSIIQL